MASRPEEPFGKKLATIRPSPAAEKDLGKGDSIRENSGRGEVISYQAIWRIFAKRRMLEILIFSYLMRG